MAPFCRETYNQVPLPPRHLFSVSFPYACLYFMKIEIRTTLGRTDPLLTHCADEKIESQREYSELLDSKK